MIKGYLLQLPVLILSVRRFCSMARFFWAGLSREKMFGAQVFDKDQCQHYHKYVSSFKGKQNDMDVE